MASSEREAHAAATAAEGSIGRALEGDSEAYVDARDAAEAMLKTVAQAATPAQRLAAARALGGDKVDRDELGRRLRLVASMLRDLGVLLSRADERSLANGDLKPVLARLLPAFDADRAAGRVRRGRPGAAGAGSQRQPEDRRGLGRVSGVMATRDDQITEFTAAFNRRARRSGGFSLSFQKDLLIS